jgi:hypothetical protein
MTAPGYVTGRDCKLYYSTTGIGGTPTWVELKITKTPSLGLEGAEAEVDDRDGDFTRYLVGKLKAPLELTISRKVGNAGYLALRNAFLTRGVIGIAQCSGDMETAGNEIFMGDFLVTKFPIEEGLNDALEVAATLQLAANSANAPSFADVAA